MYLLKLWFSLGICPGVGLLEHSVKVKVLVTQPSLILCNSIDYIAHQALLSMEFSRQEYWSGLSFPPPGDLPDPGIEVGTPESQADSLPSEPPGKSLSHSFNSGQFESRENCRTRV